MADITGTSGADRQTGGAENDALRSSAGDDAISGGAGFDTYALSLGRITRNNCIKRSHPDRP